VWKLLSCREFVGLDNVIRAGCVDCQDILSAGYAVFADLDKFDLKLKKHVDIDLLAAY